MRTKQVIDYPAGYLCLEDKISMMQRVQQMQLIAKEKNLDAYPAPDYTKLQGTLAESCISEITALDKIAFEGE